MLFFSWYVLKYVINQHTFHSRFHHDFSNIDFSLTHPSVDAGQGKVCFFFPPLRVVVRFFFGKFFRKHTRCPRVIEVKLQWTHPNKVDRFIWKEAPTTRMDGHNMEGKYFWIRTARGLSVISGWWIREKDRFLVSLEITGSLPLCENCFSSGKYVWVLLTVTHESFWAVVRSLWCEISLWVR